ncbi:hypothetical protein BN2476_320200 [Paraburkholderia piptadeniae]|uniref:Uncharacterized protein n=1 Tax=Paraburkholderia piptadeniae TaxID=1701573 RepID=A0A1N7S5K8_9BURK|nr:hypothetical protein BN2476_320200 [Paraburkholderia piptadeniae]
MAAVTGVVTNGIGIMAAAMTMITVIGTTAVTTAGIDSNTELFVPTKNRPTGAVFLSRCADNEETFTCVANAHTS